MSNLAIRLKIEPQRTIAFGSISSSYAGIGSAYAHPVRLYMIQNFTDAALQFSWDGINDHFPLAAGGSMIIDITSNKTATGGMFAAAEGDRTYVKTIDAPTSGSVYLTIFYGFEN
ncbi:MAG TPA: hypothetical protein VL443_06320 [Cyclobacteriaceae bacterium]|jgi:hypothetical protein|nr:hypothetical protein [Cyclobacteriaceae bacterium]